MSSPTAVSKGLQGVLAATLVVALNGCDLAPAYVPPTEELPRNYRGDDPFQIAEPGDLEPKGAWWTQFDDRQLDDLESQLVARNPDLAAMSEDYEQSRDLVVQAKAGLFPQLSAGAGFGYEKESEHTPYRNLDNTTPLQTGDNRIALAASWEPDIWDQVRNEVRTQSRLAQASAATLAGLRLSLQAELASDYVALRGTDLQIGVYRNAINSYEQAVTITTLRFNGKIASGIDVQRAQSQLAATKQLLEGAEASRSLLEHAIATLVGSNPTTFSIAPDKVMPLALQPTPVGVPSVLLERRPDIAAAERRVAAANASIGVVKAAFYPQINLSAIAGFEDTGLGLASLPNDLWSVGSGLALPLFEGGLRHAELRRSWSQYDQARDAYRSTVLSAFKEVEDGLAQSTHLRAQVRDQTTAATAADKAQALALQLYVGGLTNYLDVVVAQETALSAHIVETQLGIAQFQAEIGLIRALGGGWTTNELPSESDVAHMGTRQPS